MARPARRSNAKTIPASTGSEGARLRGFLLPDAMDDDEADALLTEYAENRERVNKVLTLMACNFAIIEQLHGHDTVLPPTRTEAKREKRTTGDFMSARFAEALRPRDDAMARNE